METRWGERGERELEPRMPLATEDERLHLLKELVIEFVCFCALSGKQTARFGLVVILEDIL
jgi:hypothetical protein